MAFRTAQDFDAFRRGLLAVATVTIALGGAMLQGAIADEPGANRAAVPRDWPQFLGPQRNGISAETGLIRKFPADGPKEVFRVRGGGGMSGLAIAGGKLVTMVQREGKQTALALDAASGKTLFEVAVAPAYQNQMGNGPRGTPAIAGGLAFVYTGEGILAAIDLEKGTIVWQRDVMDELGGQPADYGAACSPLIVGNLVVVTPGAPQGTIAAFDQKSGKPAWKTVAGAGDTSGYSSPALRKAGGVEQIVAFEGKATIGVSPKDGAILWRFTYTTDFDCNIATPLEHDGRIFISSGENHGCALLALAKKGDSFTPTPVWESHGPESVMRNEWQTSILIGGHLYGMDNVGGAGPVTHLNCVDVATGKRVWQEKRFGKGNLISADGVLWISTLKGELVLVKATPDHFEELDRATVLGPTRQAPSLANGLLYLRDEREIVCMDIRAK